MRYETEKIIYDKKVMYTKHQQYKNDWLFHQMVAYCFWLP